MRRSQLVGLILAGQLLLVTPPAYGQFNSKPDPKHYGGASALFLGPPSALWGIALLDSERIQGRSPLPDIPICKGLLTPSLYQEVSGRLTDPMDIFERWREAGVMITAPPLLECLHQAWLFSHAGSLPSLFHTPLFSNPESSRLPAGVLRVETARKTAAVVSPNIPLPWTGNPATSGLQSYQNETAIAIDPTNAGRAVAAAISGYRDPATACSAPMAGLTQTTVALYVSLNSQTWNYACAPWPSASVSLCGTNCSYTAGDPSVAWDGNGVPFACFLVTAACEGCLPYAAAIVLARYDTQTNLWSPVGYVVNRLANNVRIPDKPFLHIDTSPSSPHFNRKYVTWSEFNTALNQSDLLVGYSDDATTWTPVTLDQPAGKANGGNLATGQDGTVYAVWQRWAVSPFEAPENSMFAKSADGGQTWSTATTIYTHNANLGFCAAPPIHARRLNAFGVLDVDNNPQSPFFGRLYYTTNDIPSGGNCGNIQCSRPSWQTSVDVYHFYSANGGAAWSQTAGRLNDDDPTTNGVHFFPWLAVDQSDGSVNVAWYDSRIDTVNNNKTQVIYARSVNGGATFEPNVLLTDGGSNFLNNVNYSNEDWQCAPPFGDGNPGAFRDQYGDYMALAAANRQVRVAWVDSRQFWPTTGTLQEDAALGLLTNCSPPSWDAAAPTVTVGTGMLNIAWNAASAPGIGATSVVYQVFRSTSVACTIGQEITPAGGITATSFADSTGGPGTTYYYKVAVRNNCPGTVLTPMSVTSACSVGVVFPSTATSFYTVTACRVLDTRNPDGPLGGPALVAGGDRVFPLAGNCSIPSTAKAVSINVTVTQPTALGDLRLYPGGSPLPSTSTINYRLGQTRANNGILLLGPAGDLAVHCDQASGTTHFILDVNGYFQ